MNLGARSPFRQRQEAIRTHRCPPERLLKSLFFAASTTIDRIVAPCEGASLAPWRTYRWPRGARSLFIIVPRIAGSRDGEGCCVGCLDGLRRLLQQCRLSRTSRHRPPGIRQYHHILSGQSLLFLQFFFFLEIVVGIILPENSCRDCPS